MFCCKHHPSQFRAWCWSLFQLLRRCSFYLERFSKVGGVDMKQKTTHSSPQEFQTTWPPPGDFWLWLYILQHHQENIWRQRVTSMVGESAQPRRILHTCTKVPSSLRRPTFWSPVRWGQTAVGDCSSTGAQTFSEAHHSCTCSRWFDRDLRSFKDVFWRSKQTADFYWLPKEIFL